MENKKIENSCLTVSEIAEKANVSRNKVWSYIRKNSIKPIDKKGKSFKFDKNIVSELIQKQDKKQVKTDNNKNNAVSDDYIETLKKQLDKKDSQIESLQNTVNYLKQENISLHLENKNKQKLIDDKAEKLNAVSADDLKTSKKYWWQRIF